MKTLKMPELPPGEVVWAHQAGPPSEDPDREVVVEYLKAHGIGPDQVRAVEFYRGDSPLAMLRVELFAVAAPPGFQYEKGD